MDAVQQARKILANPSYDEHKRFLAYVQMVREEDGILICADEKEADRVEAAHDVRAASLADGAKSPGSQVWPTFFSPRALEAILEAREGSYEGEAPESAGEDAEAEEQAIVRKHMTDMRTRSGEVRDNRKIVEFLYTLVRDHVPLGVVEGLMIDIAVTGEKERNYTNGWLARYAQDVAAHLLG